MRSDVHGLCSILLIIIFKSLSSAAPASEAEGNSYVLKISTTFIVPNGTFHLRVLAVGGGGGGCGGIKQGRGGSGELVVNIIELVGPRIVNVSVGKGGLGARGHSVEPDADGMSSQFGNYVTATGGRGCTGDFTERSLMEHKGFRLLRNIDIIKGTDGMDSALQTSTVQGGEGGVLINGTGPFGDPGGGNISATGGAGYGAGGGAGGAVYLSDGPLIYSGGNGADGVVYAEIIDTVCSLPVDIIFAVESRDSKIEFEHEIKYIQNIVTHFNILPEQTRVALISYAHENHLKFGFNDYKDSQSLLQGLAAIKNDLNTSAQVSFTAVYQTALIAFHESRPAASQALVLLTFAANVTKSGLVDNLLNIIKNKGISMSVVAMGAKTNMSSLVSLAGHVHNLYTGTSTNAVPWIADSICKDSLKTIDASTATPAFTLSPSTILHNINSSITVALQPTSLPFAVRSTAVESTSRQLPSPTITASAAVSNTPSVFKQGNDQKTVQELEKDLDEVLSLNMTTITIDDISTVQSYVSLAGNLITESHRIPNATERGIQFKLLKRVEDIGLTVAEQMEPTKDGYKALKLSSGKVDMAVASVNISQMELLRFPDILGDDFSKNSFHHSDRVILPRAAFLPNSTGLGQVVWMMLDALEVMNVTTNFRVGSRIMNIIVKPRQKLEFEEPVKMTFWLPKAIDNNVENDCVFWDQNITQVYGVWSTDGCHVTQRNHSTVTCHCNHLTSFAVLIKVTQHKPKQEHELPLSIITCVGCGLSILGCILTILTYALLTSLRSQRHFIHINLVIAILFAQVLFLVAAFGVRPETSQIGCYVISVGLFFFFLCVFSWMLVEGLHIYFMVVRVFDSGRGRKLYYLLIGWGFPFIVTAVVVSIFQSKLLSREICWLSIETGAIWSFVGPAIFVLVINLVILVMVMRVTSKMLNEESTSSQSSVRSLAKAFVTLLPILGLTWVFGLLSVNNSSIVFEYLFAIFNSLQGLLIFLFYCVRNSEVRREFKRKMRNLEAKRHPKSTSNPSGSVPKNPPPEMKCTDSQTHGQDKTAESNYFETKL